MIGNEAPQVNGMQVQHAHAQHEEVTAQDKFIEYASLQRVTIAK